MQKEDKKRLKQFTLDKKEDFIFYLRELLVRMDICLDGQKRYLDEFGKILSEYKLDEHTVDAGKIKFPYSVYSRYQDMVSNVQDYALNIIGDSQDKAMSYFKFRNIIDKRKKRNSLGFNIRDIDDDIREHLGEANKSRNWIHHIPESLLTAKMELLEAENRTMPYTPITIPRLEYANGDYVLDFYLQSKNMYKNFKHVYQSMKKDYADLIGEGVRFHRPVTLIGRGMEELESAKMSAQIQGLKL